MWEANKRRSSGASRSSSKESVFQLSCNVPPCCISLSVPCVVVCVVSSCVPFLLCDGEQWSKGTVVWGDCTAEKTKNKHITGKQKWNQEVDIQIFVMEEGELEEAKIRRADSDAIYRLSHTDPLDLDADTEG